MPIQDNYTFSHCHTCARRVRDYGLIFLVDLPKRGAYFLQEQLHALNNGGLLTSTRTGLRGICLWNYVYRSTTHSGGLVAIRSSKVPLGAALLSQLSLNVSLTSSKNIANATLGPAPLALPDSNATTLSSYTRYKVRNTKVTIEFHSFGSSISIQEGIFTIVPALSRVLRHCVMGRGGKPITSGYFRYTHEFDSGNVTRFSVADFREDGRPMTWIILADTLRGMSEFMKNPDRGYSEVSFEVEEDGVGYVGSGYLELVSPPSTAFV